MYLPCTLHFDHKENRRGCTCCSGGQPPSQSVSVMFSSDSFALNGGLT